jgi:hypothetical protein
MYTYTRRRFLKQAASAGALSLALPTLSGLNLQTFNSAAISVYSYDGGDLPDLDFTLDEILLKHGSQFEAHASPIGVFAGAARILTLGAAAATILEWFGVRSPFSAHPSYSYAHQCESCYRNSQSDLTNRGVHYFTDVVRPTRANDVSAMLASTTSGYDTSNTAQVTTQHGSHRAIRQTGSDPGVLIASLDGLREQYPGDDRFAPYAVTAIDKRTTQLPDGAPAMRYETPIHTVIHDHRRNGNYTGGIAYIHRKADRRNPDNKSWMGLYV